MTKRLRYLRSLKDEIGHVSYERGKITLREKRTGDTNMATHQGYRTVGLERLEERRRT